MNIPTLGELNFTPCERCQEGMQFQRVWFGEVRASMMKFEYCDDCKNAVYEELFRLMNEKMGRQDLTHPPRTTPP